MKKVLGKNKRNTSRAESDLLSSNLSWDDTRSSALSSTLRVSGSDNSSTFFRTSRTKISSSGSFCTKAQRPRTSTGSSSLVNELSRLKFDWLNLYGREEELDTLHRAFARLGSDSDNISSSNTDVVSKDTGLEHATIKEQQECMNLFLLGGKSGAGKSAIIKEFIQEGKAKDKHALFVSGKFDQYLSTPYAPFRSSFSQLCSKILTHELFKDQLKDDILQVFGEGEDRQQSCKVLRDLIPNIDALVHQADLKSISSHNKSPATSTDVSPSRDSSHNTYVYEEESYDIVRSEKKFKFLLMRFLGAVCKPQHKVVLVLEDIHWIDRDTASLNLLEMILLEPMLHSSLLVICSYRDNEVSNEHPFFQRLQNIEQKLVKKPEQMTVCNLTLLAVHSFVTDLLNTDREKTEELAKIAHKKVQGNAFFLIQFLTALRDGGFLKFDIGTMKWTWDETEIRKSTVVADNVLTILMEKMNKLSSELKRVLQIAACFGASFDEIMITIVDRELKHSNLLVDSSSLNDSHSVRLSTSDILENIVNEGLIECCSNEFGERTYHFAHDQIEVAANSLLDKDKLPELKLTIGRILYENRTSFDYQSLLFLIVDLWNEGGELVTQPDDIKLLISLNHEGGMKAMEFSAFETSTVYLRKAIEFIPKDKRWTEHYSLTLELYNCLIKAEFSAGKWEYLRKNIDEVLAQKSQSILDKHVAYKTMITVLVVKDRDHLAAINCTVDVLAQLGSRFRTQLGLLAVVGALIKTKNLVKKIPLESLLEKEYMNDPIKKIAINILAGVNFSLYAANPGLLLCTVLKTLRWSLKYGLSKETPKCLGFYSLLQLGMGNLDAATNTAKLAIRLAEKQKLMNTEFAPMSTVFGLVLPWTTPIHVCVNYLLAGYSNGLKSGNLQYSFLCICWYCYFGFIEGKPLVSLESTLREYCRQMRECNQSLQLQFTSLYWQSSLNMMGRCDDPIVLTGEAMSQEETLHAAEKYKNAPLRAQIYCQRLLLAVYYHRFDVASQLLDQTSSIAKVNAGNPMIWRTALFEGITAFELVRRQKEKTKTKKWKKIALSALAKVQKWVDGGNMNCVSILYILQAEKAAMDKNYINSLTLFNKAISTAARNGLRNDRALANERCADMCFYSGDIYWARDYLQKAHQAYTDMEAFGKVDQLERENSWLRPCLVDEISIVFMSKDDYDATSSNSDDEYDPICNKELSSLAAPFSVSTLTKSMDSPSLFYVVDSNKEIIAKQ